jgi:pimeloyl-ACP methyl ester carboxylesterase
MNHTLSCLLLGCLALGAADGPISITETGNGDPIVFLPGLGCRGEVWNAVVERLPGHHSILVSIAGFGGMPGRQTDFAAVRDSLARLVRNRNWHNVTLVGHSFGGSLALSLAASHRELFAKVAILDAYPFPGALLKPGISPAEAGQVAAALRRMTMSLSDEQYRAQQTQLLRMMIAGGRDNQTVLSWMLASDRQTLAEAQFEMLSMDLRPAMEGIRCPLLVLGAWRGREAAGLSHESVEATLKEQYGAAPHCRIEISDSARHFLLLDDPEWVARRIASLASQ